MKILLVDDDPDLLVGHGVRAAAGRLPRRQGRATAWRRSTRSSASSRISRCSTSTCRRMNGFELAQKLRERSQIPLIMLTARSEEEDVVRALALGADDYLSKPFSPKILIARVKALLRRAGAEAERRRRRRLAVARRAGAHAARACRAGRCGSRRSRRGSSSCCSRMPAAPCRRIACSIHVWGNRAGGNRQLLEAARAPAAAEDRGRSGRAAARPQRAERGLSAGPGRSARAPRRPAA